VAVSFSGDRTSFTLIFSEYIAQIGPGVSLAQSHSNCRVNGNLHLPGGWQFSIASADYRGYVHLDEGLSALQEATYYVQGESAALPVSTPFNGPVDQDYHVHDDIPFQSTIWSPCGGTLPIYVNTQVRITKNTDTPASAQGIITADSIDGKITHKLGFQWRQC